MLSRIVNILQHILINILKQGWNLSFCFFRNNLLGNKITELMIIFYLALGVREAEKGEREV